MKVGKSWISAPRLLAIAVTGALLSYIFRQLPLRAVRQSSGDVRMKILAIIGALAIIVAIAAILMNEGIRRSNCAPAAVSKA